MCGTTDPQYEGFSPTQQAYIQGLIEQLDLQAVFSRPASSDATGDGAPAQVSVHGTPFEDLAKEEVAKLETHPWDLWPKMRALAACKQMPEGIDTFMVKHHGMFNVAPAQAGYMCRLRIPACALRGDQLAMLGDLADDLAGGYAHVTTRGNLQVREVPPEHLVNLLHRLYDIGLTSKGSGADSVRNITASPSAGFDPTELIDLRPQALELHHHILNTRDLHGIPRKFNISFDGGGSLSCVCDTNDIAFLATRLRDDVEPDIARQLPELPGGVYCRVMLGGITGHGDFARDTGYVLRPQDTPDAAVAMLRVFIAHGDRTNRNKARLKYLLDDKGFDWYIQQAQAHLDAQDTGVRFIALSEAHDAPRHPINRSGHIGVHPQAQAGTNYLGVALPVGRLLPDQMRGLGAIAQQFGRNDIRLTVWQNVLIPHIADADVPAAVAAIKALGLSVKASSFAAGAVACTGRMGCRYASTHTKDHAARLVDHLQTRFDLDTPINIHLTGCPHSCAQHYIGDIGLLGASTVDGVQAYHVFLGGGADHDRAIARRLCGPIPATDLPILLETVIATYLEHRRDSETFATFTQRQPDEQLQALFAEPVPA